jgi:hypothetical protein
VRSTRIVFSRPVDVEPGRRRARTRPVVERRVFFMVAPQSAFLRSRRIAFAKRQSVIRDPKKRKSRPSMTPFVIELKWVRKLNDRTASTTAGGAQPLTKSRTIGNPARMKTRQNIRLRTNAITCFFVIAEMHCSIELAI